MAKLHDDAAQLIERGRKMVYALEAGDGRAAFSDAGYGEGDHAQGQRFLHNAEAALEEALAPATPALRARQYWRALSGWAELRGEELKREGFHALQPRLAPRHAMELVGRLRVVARNAVADERLTAASKDLRDWLDRWTPLARKVTATRPELAERLGVTPAPPKAEKAAGAAKPA